MAEARHDPNQKWSRLTMNMALCYVGEVAVGIIDFRLLVNQVRNYPFQAHRPSLYVSKPIGVSLQWIWHHPPSEFDAIEFESEYLQRLWIELFQSHSLAAHPTTFIARCNLQGTESIRIRCY